MTITSNRGGSPISRQSAVLFLTVISRSHSATHSVGTRRPSPDAYGRIGVADDWFEPGVLDNGHQSGSTTPTAAKEFAALALREFRRAGQLPSSIRDLTACLRCQPVSCSTRRGCAPCPPIGSAPHRGQHLAARAHAESSRHRRHRPDSVTPPQSFGGHYFGDNPREAMRPRGKDPTPTTLSMETDPREP